MRPRACLIHLSRCRGPLHRTLLQASQQLCRLTNLYLLGPSNDNTLLRILSHIHTFATGDEHLGLLRCHTLHLGIEKIIDVLIVQLDEAYPNTNVCISLLCIDNVAKEGVDEAGNDALLLLRNYGVGAAQGEGLASRGLPISQECRVQTRAESLNQWQRSFFVDLLLWDCRAKRVVKCEAVLAHDHLVLIREDADALFGILLLLLGKQRPHSNCNPNGILCT
mmetsp:Transcript_29299/g.68193  ORF Transcript_29299/g.68193 Transcript_29299/m.68193 type:complete len:222 (-) Transcript_29299:80-745(-)